MAEAMCVPVCPGMFQGILQVIKMFVLVKHSGCKYLCGVGRHLCGGYVSRGMWRVGCQEVFHVEVLGCVCRGSSCV